MENEIMKVNDVSKKFRITKETVRTWIRNNTIPHYKLNGGIFFLREELNEWFLESKVKISGEEVADA